MTHDAVEELLAAYALDAVSDGEREEIEAHLTECRRCRDEVAGYVRTASLLGSDAAPPPEHLWDTIASELKRAPADGSGRALASVPIRPVTSATAGRRRLVTAAAALVAAALVAVGAIQLANLQSEVHQLRTSLARTGLAAAVASAEAAPHRTIQLTSTRGRDLVTVVVSRDERAYWVASRLAALGRGRTYQIWGLSGGHAVSLGLAGSDPHEYSAFRISSLVTQVMVTAEPAGGSPTPTTPVLAASKVL